MESKSATPLAQLFALKGITQERAAEVMNTGQGHVSKWVCHGVKTPAKAAQILDKFDPRRQYLTELHLLYPERYRKFEIV